MITWDGNDQNVKVERVLDELKKDGIRFNMGVCDNMGRLYIGTMRNEDDGDDIFDYHNRNCGLYKWTKTDGLQLVQDNFCHVGGLTTDNDQKKLFFIDSATMKIKVGDVDDKTGNVTNIRTFMNLTREGRQRKNVPYGMTMDRNGNLYVAMLGGGMVLRINTR